MIRIHIANMACGGCAKSVTRIVLAAAPGAEVTPDLERRDIALTGEYSVQPVMQALLAGGWQASATA
ncbi:MAG: copper chaperone [Rubritepida sp.]|nr:copper chaperone [Rubritepida sp.]